MMRYTGLKHQFVTNLPDRLEPGVLYISFEYATAAHLCCCGCGVEVVTPFTPTDWKMIFDGETISLWPSIGNWNDQCRSHYVIERSRVIPARPWSDRQIEAEWQRDRAVKQEYFGHDEPKRPESVFPAPLPVAPRLGWWSKIVRCFGRR